MRSVRSSGNKSTELFFIHLLKVNKIKGWRRHYPVKGKPDIVFLKQRIAIFLDGCFWHGHDCRNTKPKQNKDYWFKKISRNRERDERITRYFQSRDWEVHRIWECELSTDTAMALIERIRQKTKNH